MTTIVAFCVSDKVGGGELYLVRLLAALQDRGWTATIVGPPETQLTQICRNYDVLYQPANLGPKLGRRTAIKLMSSFGRQRRTLLAHVADMRPDVVLLQYKWEQLLAGGSLHPAATAIIEHGPIPRPILRLPLLRTRYRRTVQGAHTCFAASEPARLALSEAGVTPTMLLAGVDASGPTRQAPGARRGLFAGRLEPSKGVLEAIELVLRSPGHSITVAGAGSLEREVRKLSATYPDRVTYLGRVSNVDNLIQESDYGLLPTSDPGEGRPLFALECVARGRPVLARIGNAAMNGLADELGDVAVRRLDDPQLLDGEIEDDWTLPIAPRARSWSEAAGDFVHAIGLDQQ